MRKQSLLTLYLDAKKAGHKPALLESLGPKTHFAKKSILGRRASAVLEVRDGKLFIDGKHGGEALHIFNHLKSKCRETWIGFFGYEFARYFGLPTNYPGSDIPEAHFRLYDDIIIAEQSTENLAPNAITPINIELKPQQFTQNVAHVLQEIRNGNVYQVNLARQFQFERNDIEPTTIYNTLRAINPSPFMGLIEDDNWAIVSASPERLFSYQNNVLSSRPIAGTRPRGKTHDEDVRLEQDLRSSEKEIAEHTMLVDLLRNDLSQVCVPGTVHVPEAYTVERYSHVMHLVSEVEGRCHASLQDVMAAIFPGGTITGTPKKSAMHYIAKLEPPRGAYTGALGYVSSDDIDFNILIRTISLTQQQGCISAGAGIVMQSDASREYEEIVHKATALCQALNTQKTGMPPAPPKRNSTWVSKVAPKQHPKANILFLENQDSSSYNIVGYLKMLGCSVDITSNTALPTHNNNITHIITGPGPGTPQQAGHLMAWTQFAIEHKIPLLGICLGHQALGVLFGASLTHSPSPIHGGASQIMHHKHTLFSNIPSPTSATRYNSLTLQDLQDPLIAIARSIDNQIMAIAHKHAPAYGVQFHPESILSSDGLRLLSNFLEMRHQ